VDDWVTPVGEMAEHLVIAICLWGLFGRRDLSSDCQSTLRLSKKVAHVASWAILQRGRPAMASTPVGDV